MKNLLVKGYFGRDRLHLRTTIAGQAARPSHRLAQSPFFLRQGKECGGAIAAQRSSNEVR
jgi:hypothetical protein